MILKNHTIIILMSLSMITWGVAWTSAKISSEYLSYNNLVFLRFFFASLSLAPFLIKRKINLSINVIKMFISILITSVLFFIYNQAFFMGTNLGKSGVGGVFVTTTNPIITFIMVSFLKRDFNVYKIFSVSLGVLGGLITLNVFNLGFNAFLFPGNKYFIFCSLSWGIMTVIMSYAQKNIDSIWYIAFCYFLTSIISFFFIDYNEIIYSKLYDFKFLINFFVVFSSMSFGTSIYILAAYKLGPILASSFIFSVPFIAIGASHIFLKEPLGLNIIIGGVFSLFSIYLVNQVSSKKYN
jgi:drug/metabolite transporter (DMT)-like permease